MTDEAHDQRRELMDELQRRFQDSAATMRRIARRIRDAADASRAVDRRAAAARHPLADHLGAPASCASFSYLEYLEFSGAGEFARFRHAAPVSDADLRAVDWEHLSKRLLENNPET